jgi:hypothetical protein
VSEDYEEPDDEQEDEEEDDSIAGMVRNDNPETCYEAAHAVKPHVSELQAEVEAAVTRFGAMHDEDLEHLPQWRGRGFGPSTVRKRRTELTQKGVLVYIGKKPNSRGRMQLVFDLASRVEAAATPPPPPLTLVPDPVRRPRRPYVPPPVTHRRRRA